MSGSTGGANLPVRVVVEGLPDAERSFNQVGRAGEAAMRAVAERGGEANRQLQDMKTTAGQAGQQLLLAFRSGDLSGGISGALSTGAELLKTYGPIGAAAAAGIGMVVSRINEAQTAAKLAADALIGHQERLERAFQSAAEFFETSVERAQRAEAATRASIALSFGAEWRRANDEAAQAQRALDALEAQRRQIIESNRFLPGFNPDTVLRDPLTAQRAALADAQRRMADADAERERALTAPSGAAREAAERQPAAAGGAPRERAMLDTLAAVTKAREEATAALDAYNQRQNLANAGMENASGLLQQYQRDMEVLNAALANGVITEDEFAAAVERGSVGLADQMDALRDRSRDVRQMGQQLQMTFSSALEDAIIRGKRLSEVFQGLAQDIARIALRTAVTQPLAQALAGAVSGIFSPSGGGASSVTSLGIVDMAVPRRAAGGPVFAGGAYMVGERGPELFVPGASGTIVPNGGGGITFAPTYAIDARGADESILPRLRAEMVAIARASNAELMGLIARGGAAAKTVGRR